VLVAVLRGWATMTFGHGTSSSGDRDGEVRGPSTLPIYPFCERARGQDPTVASDVNHPALPATITSGQVSETTAALGGRVLWCADWYFLAQTLEIGPHWDLDAGGAI
jgi:hypothetical protein